MSRLLLENSNQASEPTLLETPLLDYNTNISSIQWSTPKAGKEARLQFDILAQLSDSNLPTRRLLFRKVIKGLDKKDFALI